VILTGDIGGTKTVLALFEADRPEAPVATMVAATTDFADVADILRHFLARHPATPVAACLGIAGPVSGDTSRTTNLPWLVRASALRPVLGGAPVFLLNDLEAFAHAIPFLPPHRFATLLGGAPDAAGNAAVIAAGTGLGEAGMVWTGDRLVPFASEGGHSSFAPRTPREVRLLGFLLGRFEHVSWERVVSGPGLVTLLEFLRDEEGYEVPPAFAAALGDPPDPAVVSAAGLAGAPPIAVAALDLFAALYGAEAGNLALKLKATGGVYLGGGIAPRLVTKLADGTFQEAFLAKGRFRSLLETVPVRVVLEPAAALYGAARHAVARLAAG
jgi:glucokinase